MRRTITILNRFTISITSWLAKPRFWAFGLLVLLSCDDDLGLVGFKNPNRDFEVVAKEFTIPTKLFLMDSLSTSTGVIENSSRGLFSTPTARILVGSMEDPKFGKTTAIAYSAYNPTTYAYTNDNAVYEGVTLTMMFDYYWIGDQSASEQQFQVYEITDSLLTYLPHYNNQSTPYGALLGEGTYNVNPADFDQNVIDNHDTDTSNDIQDSLRINLDDSFGQRLFAAAMDTVGTAEDNFVTFRKFRRIFKGLAFVSPNSNKIVGFDPDDLKSRITLKYRVDTNHYEVNFKFFAPSQARSTGEYMAYTEFRTDRSGTPIAGLVNKYEDFEPADGMRYTQAGTGVIAKLDFQEVFDYFKDLPNKALSVAELKIESEYQAKAPYSYKLRVLKPNNREMKSSKTYQDAADDPYENYDPDFIVKHSFVPATVQAPYFRCDVIGDDGQEFSLTNELGTSETVFSGNLTNYMQQELSLGEADVLRYYALLPQSPDNARGLNGFYFPADKVKLTIYYTTPKATN